MLRTFPFHLPSMAFVGRWAGPVNLAGVALLVSTGVLAQANPALAPAAPPTPGFVSKPLQITPVTGVEGKEAALILVTLEPGASSPPHNHPGDCIGVVIDGVIDMRAEGQAIRRLAAGEAYQNLGGVPHQFTNVGDKPVRMINTLIVDKGKPRLVVLPAPIK